MNNLGAREISPILGLACIWGVCWVHLRCCMHLTRATRFPSETHFTLAMRLTRAMQLKRATWFAPTIPFTRATGYMQATLFIHATSPLFCIKMVSYSDPHCSFQWLGGQCLGGQFWGGQCRLVAKVFFLGEANVNEVNVIAPARLLLNSSSTLNKLGFYLGRSEQVWYSDDHCSLDTHTKPVL